MNHRRLHLALSQSETALFLRLDPLSTQQLPKLDPAQDRPLCCWCSMARYLSIADDIRQISSNLYNLYALISGLILDDFCLTVFPVKVMRAR